MSCICRGYLRGLTPCQVGIGSIATNGRSASGGNSMSAAATHMKEIIEMVSVWYGIRERVVMVLRLRFGGMGQNLRPLTDWHISGQTAAEVMVGYSRTSGKACDEDLRLVRRLVTRLLSILLAF